MKPNVSISQDCHVHTTFSDGSGTMASNIIACSHTACDTIAFTDHVDEHGNFMFLPTFREQQGMQAYLAEIACARHVDHRVRVVAGLEFMGRCTATVGSFLSAIEPHAAGLELLLVDGSCSSQPDAIAIQLHDRTRRKPFTNIHVAIAHPNFEQILQGDIEGLITRGILLELNESKFRRVDSKCVLDMMEIARECNIKKPRFITGTDAHSSLDVGKFPVLSTFLASNSLHHLVHHF